METITKTKEAKTKPVENYLPQGQIKLLKKQKHLLFGHSSAKLCHYTKTALSKKKFCYKFKFYGIASHRCVQMSPVSNMCDQQCTYCWRPINWQSHEKLKEFDEPEAIVKESIDAQKKLLSGFGSLVKQGLVDKNMFEQSKQPKHVAISLTGEPTLYPKLSDLVKNYHKRRISTFLVSNGMHPEVLENMEELPTQLYISVDAPTEEMHKKLNNPVLKDSWHRLNKTITLLPKLNCRKVLRATLVKGANMCMEKEFAELFLKGKPDFVELKAYMYVGFSRQRMKEWNMPSMKEVKEFSEKIVAHMPEYEICDEFEDSRVVLLWNKKTPKIINFEKFFEGKGY